MLIIFDLDDTLIATTKVTTPKLLLRVINFLHSQGLLKDVDKSFNALENLSLSLSNTKAALESFFKQYEIPTCYLDHALAMVYEADIKELPVEPMPGALDCLAYLQNLAGLAIVSIGIQKRQLEKIEKAKIPLSSFSKIVILEKGKKGDAYQSIIESFGVDAHQVIVCGDKVDIDLLPAKKIGCYTVQILSERTRFLKDQSPLVDFSISQLSEIAAILEYVSKKQSVTG